MQIIRIQNSNKNLQNSNNQKTTQNETLNIMNEQKSNSETEKITEQNEEIIQEYILIIYGDINGDGKINSTDLLKLQRHILEIEQLDIYSQKAGNIAKNGKKPTSLDLLLIQRDILGLQKITQ